MSKNLTFFATSSVIVALLFASSLTLTEEKRAQLNPEAQALDALSEEFSVLRKVFDGFQGSDPNNLLWNRADDVIVLDSTLFQKDDSERIVPAIYFSLNQQDTFSPIKFSTIGIGLLFYLNR